MRMSYATSLATIKLAVERLAAFMHDLEEAPARRHSLLPTPMPR